MRADCVEPKDGGEHSQRGSDARISGTRSLQSAIAVELGANAHVVGRVRKGYGWQWQSVVCYGLMIRCTRQGRLRSNLAKEFGWLRVIEKASTTITAG